MSATVSAAAPLLAALRAEAAALPAERIDRVWLFPARRVGSAESSLAVVSLLDPTDPSGRRTILTLRCTTTPGPKRASTEHQLLEQGSAPADRVEAVMRGVLRRLRDAPEEPQVVEVLGRAERWLALLESRDASA